MAGGTTVFQLRRTETRAGPVALVTIDDGLGRARPTTFGAAALRALGETLDRLESGSWAGLVLTGKPEVFAAGADVDELPRHATPELARRASRAGHELFGRLRALPFPTLAAVNGDALGGGVEIALHCDARTVSSTVRRFACPEVFLGIVPAWGGTQLVPRLVGARRAVDFVVANPLRQNRMLTGLQAFEAGFADALLEPDAFLDDSLELLVAAVERGGFEREPPPDLADLPDACRQARLLVDDLVHGAAPAPYRALELIEGAGGWSLEEGYRAEETALAELLPGPEARASLYAFDVVERRVRRGTGRPAAEPRPVGAVGVAGAGLMARQLGLLCARWLETPVVFHDLTREQADDGVAWVRGELETLAARGRLSEQKARALASGVTGCDDVDELAGCDLVLEAVFEELDVKRAVFRELERVVSPDCLLATNTSALSVAAIAAAVERPARVVGMHFFNPVAVLPLVELVRTESTGDEALATAWTVAERLGKRAVLVRDAPGFVVNRVLTRMTVVLLDALEHGNTIDETDEAVLRIGLPVAPSVLLGMVGPAVANHVLETLHGAFPERFPRSATLAGFAAGADEIVRRGDRRRSVDELQEAVLEALADEISHVLRDGVVASAADVDACLILGAGFPFFRGGITPYLDASGVSARVAGRPLATIAAER